MTTHLYVLAEEGTRLVETYSPVFGASRVVVKGKRDWYAARARAIQHAIDAGHAKIIITVGTAEYYHRPHWNGLGEPTEVARMEAFGQHGLWLHFDRLLNRFGHVYVPPLSACRAWHTYKKNPWMPYNNPVIPSVAGYVTSTLAQLTDLEAPFGQRLCGNGYDSFTMNDYFYYNLGEDHLDETGSATTWRKSYERSIISAT